MSEKLLLIYSGDLPILDWFLIFFLSFKEFILMVS